MISALLEYRRGYFFIYHHYNITIYFFNCQRDRRDATRGVYIQEKCFFVRSYRFYHAFLATKRRKISVNFRTFSYKYIELFFIYIWRRKLNNFPLLQRRIFVEFLCIFFYIFFPLYCAFFI